MLPILILAIAVLTTHSVTAASISGKDSQCLTKACILEAAHLLRRLNTSVDPCDDFYEFACGGYIEDTEIPDDKPELNPLVIISDLVSRQVKRMITEKIRPGEIKPFTLLKRFFAACANTTLIEHNGLDPIKTVFSNLGGCPALDGSNWTESSWIDLSKKLRKHGFNTFHFIAVDMDINSKNSSEYIVSVDQALNEEIGDANLKRGLKDGLVRLYADYLIDLVTFLGVDKEFAKKEVHDVIEFRAKIANISVEKTEHVKLIIAANESTVADLIKDYPSIPWLEVINSVLAPPKKVVSEQDKIILIMPEYVSELEKILSATPTRVLTNHAMLQVLRSSVHFLPKHFREREQKFLATATGVTKSLPRWEICTTYATKFFHLAADALYVRTYVDEQARADVTEMVDHIREAFVKILEGVDWMDKDTKKEAIEKAKLIKSYIAYPPELLDDKLLDEYYAEVNLNSNDVLEMISEISKSKRNKELTFYGGPVMKVHWTTRLEAITSNAVYDPQSNSIQIPSGIMQNEFYNKDRPQYMNYGGLGMVIGHEITHGFDDTGKAFDENGNTADWWEQDTLQAYSSKAQCFVEQYGNYTVPEIKLNINGETTLGENIADNGGIKAAYLAYLDWIQQNREEPTLPALKYSPKQLFWISVANAWCGKIRKSALEQAVVGDEHSPDRYRILGGFSNMKHFVEDFSCPAGSKMNPEKKCQVW